MLLYNLCISVCVFVCLCRYGDHYEWNKAVTCIHNVLSQQRWLEHYGEVVIRNTKSDVCTCKITFVKVRTHSTHTLITAFQSPFHTDQKTHVCLPALGFCLRCECIQSAFTIGSDDSAADKGFNQHYLRSAST